ncbi:MULTISPECIES: DUF4180 domain-containing protein [unclassified Parvimonas]|uniref:DUF4180 domain-containing protein n=1 Tax=unclassified Parvimonas TaxID=1151464 RepID=UPI002B459B5E|nr:MULTISPECIES: DUF4180 domain-containing protein [unclassified Parvimonas]MEB3025669.1 DUF4180 domain-containing protein [Parvimonas sp. M13]MEB3073354.1 DUF4180 domain-containing protein [Parvimonas sp. C2]MEB3089812.1 DUF4180 domain-containing protein [Parvimonas sp. M20]
MEYRIINIKDNINVVKIEDEKILIFDEQSALDVFMSLAYETGENKFIISKDNLIEDFFDLRTKIAGEILQKIINYKMKLAIIGDFSKYKSKSLRDFIYECNSGRDIFFVENEFEALNLLSYN